VDADGFVSLTDVEAACAGPGLSPATRRTLVERYRREYRTAFAGLDITDQPVETPARAGAADPGADRQAPPFRDIFTSLLHSVAVPEPAGPRCRVSSAGPLVVPVRPDPRTVRAG
jgi:hypothetical protein